MMKKHMLLSTNVILLKRENFSGILNMKIDEYLFNNFERLVSENSVIVRFYQFSNHTVTLGYSQKSVSEEILKIFDKWFFIRRITGGKAVFHYPKKDLTLCLISSLKNFINLPKENRLSFIHSFVNNLLWSSIEFENMKDKNIKTEKPEKINYVAIKKFDCFENPQNFEKTYNGKKVIGTAIKISNNKFIVQANIKLQNIFEEIDNKLIDKIESNFVKKLCKNYRNENIIDFIKNSKGSTHFSVSY